jgi:mannose-6-phosphate isomerase-like protein (cupin superfamily)
MPEKESAVAMEKGASFDLNALAAEFPASSRTMLLDMRLTDEPAASSRLFRVYKTVAPHYHKTCDEHLLVISGRGRFVVEGSDPVELGPGNLLFFRRNSIHAIPEILAEPLIVFAVDTPRRDPSDVTFVDPSYGTAKDLLATIPAR